MPRFYPAGGAGGTSTSIDTSHFIQDWDTYKWGAYTLSTDTGGDGVYNGYLSSTGTHSRNMTNVAGLKARWTTGSSSGNQAGIRTTNVITRANNNPRLRFNITYDTTSLIVFIGFTSTLGSFPSGEDLLDGDSGIGLFIAPSTATNVRVASNDASAGTDSDDILPTTTIASGGTHEFDLYTDNAGVSWHIVFDGTDNLKSTRLPVTTADLAMVAYVETTTTAAKILDIRYLFTTMDPA